MRLRFKIRYERRINAESRNTVTTSLGGLLDEGEGKKNSRPWKFHSFYVTNKIIIITIRASRASSVANATAHARPCAKTEKFPEAYALRSAAHLQETNWKKGPPADRQDTTPLTNNSLLRREKWDKVRDRASSSLLYLKISFQDIPSESQLKARQ